MKFLCKFAAICLAALLFAGTQVSAATVNVSSIAALQSAINSATSGDIIILADGTYLNSTITIGTSGITVKSATPGGVYLNGTQAVVINGNGNTFSGFQFTSGNVGSGIPIEVNGSQNLLTQLNIKGYIAQKYINLRDTGRSNVVAYCNFENKPTSAPIGNLIHIALASGVPGYHKIRYNSFQNMPGAGGDNGNECIRIENGAQSTYVGRNVVEFNYFENTGLGDSEVVSVKCRENVLRYNTMFNNNLANFCFRNGDYNIAYGNFFINSGGIRVKEANSIYCYNNYFENCGDGDTTAPIIYVYVSPNLKNINFIHNTIIGGTPIDLDSGASGNTWANNIFKNTSGSNIFMGSVAGITWAGNQYTGTLGVSIPSGMTSKANPYLVLNADGYYGLSSSSPAIDASSSSYPAILDIANVDDDPTLTMDISGQARSATVILKDVGCDEYGVNGTLNRPLLLSEVGPSYLGGPGGGNTPPSVTLTAPANGASFIAPASIAMTATASDPDGTIASVKFYNGSSLLNTDTTSPYAYTWTGVAAGSYSLTARATDNGGLVRTSAVAAVTVTAAGNNAPVFTVDPISKAAATVAVAYTGQTLSGSATDADGDTLSYSAQAGPVWLSIATAGALSGTPASGDVGDNSWQVQVSDGKGGTDTAVLNITVDAAASGGWTVLTTDDFESGWGNWVSGGIDALLSSANAIGAQCLDIQDNSGDGSSAWLSGSLDLSSYSQLKIAFTYMPISMDNVDEDFWVQFSDDGGSSWTTIKAFILNTDFVNDTRENPELIINSGSYNFTSNVKLKFCCDASGDADDIYIDNVVISGYSDGPPPVNNPPVFTVDPISKANATENAAYSGSLAGDASDPESDPLTFSKVSGPAWLSVAANGTLSGTPGAGDVGANVFTVQVAATGGSDTATLNITVVSAPVNQAPAFTVDPISKANATENAAYSGSLAGDASDPESDPLTFSKVSGPAWLSVAANGTLSGTPGAGDVGANVFTVQVAATGGSDTATLNITVDAAPSAATLLEDGFETSFDLWTDDGATDWDRNTSQKHSGSYSAHAGSADNDLKSDNLNSAGYSSMTIEFWYRDDDIDDGDNIYLQLYDGSSYINKFELGNSTEDTWHFYQVTIQNSGADAVYFRSNFRIKFEGSSIDTGENLWIDDVKVTVQ